MQRVVIFSTAGLVRQGLCNDTVSVRLSIRSLSLSVYLSHLVPQPWRAASLLS